MENVNNSYSNIRLKAVSSVFSCDRSLDYLKNKGIDTVGKLFERDCSVLALADSNMHEDIMVAIRLLKCKYLGIDPYMELYEDDTMSEIVDKLRFSNATAKALRMLVSPREFFSMIRSDNHVDLMDLPLTNACKSEIVFKASIVLNYYDKKNKKEEKNTVTLPSLDDIENGDLKEFYSELLELSKQAKEMDSKIEHLIDKALEKLINQGALKEEPFEKRK